MQRVLVNSLRCDRPMLQRASDETVRDGSARRERHGKRRHFVSEPLAKLVLWVATSAALTSCATYTDETHDLRALYQNEAYSEALKALDTSGIKDQDRNKLLYRLEKAMILDRLGQDTQARSLLLQADKISDDLYTVSVSRTATSFVYNDSATDYSGEDYEKVAIHTQLALSYIGSGDLAAARVEARKINSKLQQLNQQYDDHKNRYAEDGFARYLAGLIYEAREEWDDAIIDYGKAISLYSDGFGMFVRGGVPPELVEAQARLLLRRNRADQLDLLQKKFPKILTSAFLNQLKSKTESNVGDVAVIHEYGHITVKRAQEFLIPLGKHIVRISFPVIPRGNDFFTGSTGLVDVASNSFYEASNAADMDAIASYTLEDRRTRIIAKSVARLIAKAQITDQAEKQFGPLGWIAGNVYAAVTETADTRGWTLLPKGYFITRAHLSPGSHALKVKTGGRVGKIESVTVKKGQLVLLRAGA